MFLCCFSMFASQKPQVFSVHKGAECEFQRMGTAATEKWNGQESGVGCGRGWVWVCVCVRQGKRSSQRRCAMEESFFHENICNFQKIRCDFLRFFHRRTVGITLLMTILTIAVLLLSAFPYSFFFFWLKK